MPDRQTALRRPHFSRRGRDLYFLGSRRPFLTLSDEEASAWDSLDVPRDTGAEDPDRSALARLEAAGVADIVAPLPDGRPHILVIEPHSDDAALSLGGTMWANRQHAAFDVLTMASRSNYTSAFQTEKDFFDRDRVSRLRADEGEIVARHLGAAYHALGLKEATLRYRDADWSLDTFRAHRLPVAAWNNARAPDAVLEDWTRALGDFLDTRTWSEIWIPLGAGSHGDHDLTRNAALTALAGAARPETLRFYLDVPYGADHPDHTRRLLKELAARGAALVEDHRDVSEVWDDKMRLLGIFGSQFKVRAVAPGVEHAAGRPRTEHLWRIDRLPEARDLHEMFHGRDRIEALLPAARRWRGDGVRRLRVLLLDAAGGWPVRLEALRAAFPQAKIEVFVNAAVAAEVTEHAAADVSVSVFEGGAVSWIALALKLAVRSPAHVLFIAGTRESQARQLARLWPLSDVIVSRTMTDAVQAIAETRG